jgi:hypothetical protein
LIWACVGGQTELVSPDAVNVAGTAKVAMVHEPAVPAGQPVSVAFAVNVPRDVVSASAVGMTLVEEMAARSDASAATAAPDDALQSNLICVAPATTPAINVDPEASCPPPVIVTLQGSVDAALGVSVTADAELALVSATPATMASEAPTASTDVHRFLARRAWLGPYVFFIEPPKELLVWGILPGAQWHTVIASTLRLSIEKSSSPTTRVHEMCLVVHAMVRSCDRSMQ